MTERSDDRQRNREADGDEARDGWESEFQDRRERARGIDVDPRVLVVASLASRLVADVYGRPVEGTRAKRAAEILRELELHRIDQAGTRPKPMATKELARRLRRRTQTLKPTLDTLVESGLVMPGRLRGRAVMEYAITPAGSRDTARRHMGALEAFLKSRSERQQLGRWWVTAAAGAESAPGNPHQH